jgi:hypothetical protein
VNFATIIALIKLVASLITFFQSRGWIEQGRQEERARAMKEVLASLTIATGVQDEIRILGDEEVDKLIEERGWYRD